MAVRTEDLVAQLKQQILSFQAPTRTVDVGTVLQVGDGIARLSGLTNARAAELVEFENGTLGIVFNLEADNVGVIIMGEYHRHRRGADRAQHGPHRLGAGRRRA